MSVSGVAVEAFRREVPALGQVWTVRDGDGYPAPVSQHGQRAMPFWSSRFRAQRVVDRVPAYQGFEVVPIAFQEWLHRWLPDLERDGLLVGINWSGERASGFELAPTDVTGWFAGH
jgi:hypothetical protein